MIVSIWLYCTYTNTIFINCNLLIVFHVNNEFAQKWEKVIYMKLLLFVHLFINIVV